MIENLHDKPVIRQGRADRGRTPKRFDAGRGLPRLAARNADDGLMNQWAERFA